MSKIKYHINNRLNNIFQSPIRAFSDKISGIDGLIILSIGEPDFPTPDFIKKAAINDITSGFNGYTHTKGMLELRQKISDFLKRHYNLSYDPETQIIATVGATEANYISMLTLINAVK